MLFAIVTLPSGALLAARRLDPDPPFAMNAMSPELCFGSLQRPHDCESVQFASGLLLDEESVIIGLGVMDCESRMHRIPLGDVLAMLQPVA